MHLSSAGGALRIVHANAETRIENTAFEGNRIGVNGSTIGGNLPLSGGALSIVAFGAKNSPVSIHQSSFIGNALTAVDKSKTAANPLDSRRCCRTF